MRQKLIISGALVHRPEVIVVDEPMVGLDPKSARLLKDLFRQFVDRGGTVLMSTHTLEVAEAMCDRIAIVYGGQDRGARARWPSCRSRPRPRTLGLEELFLKLTGGHAGPPAGHRSSKLTCDAPGVQPELWTVLTPKWRSALARLRAEQSGSRARVLLLALVGVVFWTGVFGIAYRVLRYFRGVEDIGNLLAGKMLGVILLAFLSILLLSNIITALSTFFLAKDLDLLVAAPVGWSRLYLGQAGARRWCTRRGWWRCWRCRSSPRTASCTPAGRSFRCRGARGLRSLPGAAGGGRARSSPCCW